jgi:hypothetical protein
MEIIRKWPWRNQDITRHSLEKTNGITKNLLSFGAHTEIEVRPPSRKQIRWLMDKLNLRH